MKISLLLSGFNGVQSHNMDQECFKIWWLFLHRMHGTGEYTFSTGTKYVGEFKDGMFDGSGVMHFPTGTKYEATWEKGIAIEVRSAN